MGTVWSAVDLRLGREVAIKVVALSDDLTRARFMRESRVAARFDHGGLCTIFDVGETPDAGFLVMERLDGMTLHAALSTRPSWRRSLAIVAEVASAMAHAHERGLVHRDLKPDNVFLHRRGVEERVVVIDFGLAFAPQRDDGLGRVTSGDLTGGTPRYMSPEQARAGTLTDASDVYSLGCVAFELLAERPLFSGEGAEVMSKHVFAKPPDLRQLAPGVPEAAIDVIERMLDKEPGARPAMHEVARALAAMAATLTAESRRGSGAVTPVPGNETACTTPIGPPRGRVHVIGALDDELMLALAAAGFAATRITADSPVGDGVVVVDGPVAAVARATATGRPVLAVADHDAVPARTLIEAGAAAVLARPIDIGAAVEAVEAMMRRDRHARR
jgi:serine/threonine-protein kinase